MVDAVALRKKVQEAKVFVKEYKAKLLYLDALTLGLKQSTSAIEKTTLLIWMDATIKFIADNKEKYERATILTKIPETDLEQLDACDRALYGG